MRPRMLAVAAIATAAVVAVPALALTAAEDAPPAVPLSALDGSTQQLAFTVDVPCTPYKLVVDGVFLGAGLTADPAKITTAKPGAHKVRFDGCMGRVVATWTATGTTPSPSPSASPTPSPTPPPPPPADGTVNTVEEIRTALATARPGDTIAVADGDYVFRPRLVASANGTAEKPITLTGTRRAVLSSTSAGGDYGLHITGDHWHVQGLTVAHAAKGIVLDGSAGSVLSDVEVYDIGDEGVHFRACSTDGVLRDSYIHDTGVRSPQYGEGVYVGSANSNWSKFSCVDGRDNSERALIEGNVFRRTSAEGADLKEGTESGTLRGNVFEATGTSGRNSADSAVDAKGNGWLIEGNTIRGPAGANLDALQTHSVYSGYGTGNRFVGNTIEGAWSGYGIGLYPALGNVVSCDNSAPGAARGLVGANSKPATCTPL